MDLNKCEQIGQNENIQLLALSATELWVSISKQNQVKARLNQIYLFIIKVELSNIMGCVNPGQKYEEAGIQDENKERKKIETISTASPNIVITKPEEKKLKVKAVLVPPNKGGEVEEGEKYSSSLVVLKSSNSKPGDSLKILKESGHEKNSRINIDIPDYSQTVSKLPIDRSHLDFGKAFNEITKLTRKEQQPILVNPKFQINGPNAPINRQNGMDGSGRQSGKVSGVLQASGQKYGQNNPRELSNPLVIEALSSKVSNNSHLPEKSFIQRKDEINPQKIVNNSQISNPISSIAANPVKEEQQNVIQSLTLNEVQGKQPQTAKPIEPINQISKVLLQSKVPQNGILNIKAKQNQITMVGIPPKVVRTKIQFNVESEMMATFKFKMPIPFISLEAS